MKVELKKLSVTDGIDTYDMVQEIGPRENGFTNGLYGLTYEEFKISLNRYVEMSLGINLRPEHVPQSVYWLYINNVVMGYGKIRDYLTNHLLEVGGHIGYTIRPSERGKGYGKILLRELINQAVNQGIKDILFTCYEDNEASRKVIESNNGICTEIKNNHCKYWVRPSAF